MKRIFVITTLALLMCAQANAQLSSAVEMARSRYDQISNCYGAEGKYLMSGRMFDHDANSPAMQQKDYFQIPDGLKYGVIDYQQGREIVPCIADKQIEAIELPNGTYIFIIKQIWKQITKSGTVEYLFYGVYNQTGNKVVPIKYYDIKVKDNCILAYWKENEEKSFDVYYCTGQIMLPLLKETFEMNELNINGFYKIRRSNEWLDDSKPEYGLYDFINGKEILAQEYSDFYVFSADKQMLTKAKFPTEQYQQYFYAACINNKWGLFDFNGNQLTEIEYDSPEKAKDAFMKK